MSRGNVDFTIPAIKKFRRFVELNCFKRHDLKFFEQVDERKTIDEVPEKNVLPKK